MRFEAFIASRYLRGKRKNRFVSLITVIAVAGVAVGVMTLIVVMSVMTGFDEALREATIGNRSHLQIFDPVGRPIVNPEIVQANVEEICPEIVASAPFIEFLALLKTPAGPFQRYDGVRIVGVDAEQEVDVTNLAANLTAQGGRSFGYGELPDYKDVVLGYLVANRLRVGVGDHLAAITPRAAGTPLGMRPGTELWLNVSGVSQSLMSDFDSAYAFVDLKTAMKLKDQSGVDGVHVKLNSPWEAAEVSERIEEELGYATQTWYESNMAFFEALQQEKVVMFTILVFIVLVAAFNITSILIMIVMEKRRDIGILRTIGTSTGAIMRLFILEGLYIGLVGAVAGLVLGMLIALWLNPLAETIAGLLGVDLFNSQIYFFDRIPVPGGVQQWAPGWGELSAGVAEFFIVMRGDLFWVTVCAVALAFISTLYPAWSASRVDPVDALRNE
jgi:lipoprotein-releasing system permease protein